MSALRLSSLPLLLALLPWLPWLPELLFCWLLLLLTRLLLFRFLFLAFFGYACGSGGAET